jgi:hypothetical protein
MAYFPFTAAFVTWHRGSYDVQPFRERGATDGCNVLLGVKHRDITAQVGLDLSEHCLCIYDCGKFCYWPHHNIVVFCSKSRGAKVQGLDMTF